MRLSNKIRPGYLGMTLLALLLASGSLLGKDKKPKGFGAGQPLDAKELDGFRMFLEPPEPSPRQIRRIEAGRFRGDFRMEDAWERQVAKKDSGKLLDRFFQDPLALDVVRNFESLTVYILPSAKNMSGPNLQERRWLDRSNPAMNLTPDQAKRLAEIYSTPTSYLWGTRFLCGPVYGVRFDFKKGDRQISILLCLTCSHVGIIQDPGKLEHIRSEHIHLKETFPELLEIVKKLAPDNDLIQSLKVPAYTPPADDPVEH
jgi:hypothetical protein